MTLDFLTQPAEEVGPKLLGCILERQIGGHTIAVRIVETEAYDQEDEASHAHGGKKNRSAVMFGPAGHLYVYFTYGMHYCCNVVCGPEGYGAGVLIRAVEPLAGERQMAENRGGITGKNVSNGPGKLCQALAIDLSMNGHNLRMQPLVLKAGSLAPHEAIVSAKRIGISKAKNELRRFYIKDNPYVSYVSRPE
ncbi:MAG: DNA-3-methyladenine glycosylase [Candidatus Saccharimonadales bacterium]